MLEVTLLLAPLFFLAYAQEIPDYSNPYAPIFTDKEIYTWTDKVRITIVAPSWNANRYGIDSIGDQEGHFIKISNSEHTLEPYKLTETDLASGIFTGEITLTGFLHDVDGDGHDDTNPRTFGNGPTGGFLESQRDDGITISFEFADGVVLTESVLIEWNQGSIRFNKESYEIGENAIIQIFEPDLNLNPEATDQLPLEVSSDSDAAGILVNAIETTQESGVFVATISFTQSQTSGGNRLFANPGDTLYAKYEDYTLPSPYSISDSLDTIAQAKFVSNIPPIERITMMDNFLTTSSGELVLEPVVNERMQIVGVIQNNQNYAQPFVFIIQIKDSKDSIVSLSWIKGSLSPNQNLEASQSWNPVKSGNYTVESYVWNSLDGVLPLSPSLKKSYLVE